MMQHLHFRNQLTIILAFLTAFNTLIAQAPKRSCATTEVLAEQVRQNPDLLDNIQAIEEHTQRFASHSQLHTRSSTITIPVVIHIVYRTSNNIENISDKQVLSQIEALNNDYRRLNSDYNSTPSVFQSVSADCGIEFKLAKRTPDGKATTGIVRYPSARRTPWGKNDEVKIADKGGVNPWDATKYLNIYVCAVGSGILGYSTLPGTGTALDGVVIDYRYFGTIGNVVAPFNQGRTATHEIGHWLNLRHIWGDTDCGDDAIADTPVQEGPNYGCVAYPHKTCGNQQTGDMFMNFMDYTDDACMNMFTSGQKQRIHALFSTGGARASLLTSDALIPPGETCLAPTNLTVSNVLSKTAIINWTFAPSVTNYIVEYRITNATNWTILNVNNANSLAITSLTPDKTYECRTKSVCTDKNSEYSSTLTFSTLTASETCSDAFESNNSFTTAKLIPNNTTLNALISTKTDNDYFVFKHTDSNKDIKIALTNLPYDYDVRLYNANRQLVGSSTRNNRSDELITLSNAPIGFYYVRVYPYSGSTATQCYKLSIEAVDKDYLRENTTNVLEEKPADRLRVSPNPASELVNVELETGFEGDAQFTLIDMTGKRVIETTQPISKDITLFQLDINNVREGMYILMARCGNKVHNQKLIVNKQY